MASQELLEKAKAIQNANLGDKSPEREELLAKAQEIQKGGPQPMAPIETPDVSSLEAAGRGGLQGFTGGYSDEIKGGIQAGYNKLLGDPEDQKRSFKELYQQYRDLDRAKNKAAEDAHPYIYGGGNIAGGVAGLALAPEALVAKLGTVGGAAALGAATGLGTSDADLTSGNGKDVAKAALDTTLGAGAGFVGGKIGQKVSNALNPEKLEVAGSKLASKAMGIKPTKELTSEFNDETGRMMQGSDVIKGIGKTVMNEGALPATGGPEGMYDAVLGAIDNNYKKLNPIVPKVQQQLDQNLAENVSKVRPVADKASQLYDKFVVGIPQSSQKDVLADKIFQNASYYTEKLAQNEGNLQGLVGIKQELQQAASDLNANVFDPNKSLKDSEAKFLKQMGGVVRQHIEDLAATVDPQAAQDISSINKSLSNLYIAKEGTRNLQNKVTNSSLVSSIPNAISKAFTGNPLSRLGKIGAARGLNAASKAINTPAGQLVQKTVVNASKQTINNPFSQQAIQDSAGRNLAPESQSATEATRTAGNLYNATPESLKAVAGNLKTQPGLQYYGEHLEKAIENNDEDAKNRAVFLILQNPLSRRLVSPE